MKKFSIDDLREIRESQKKMLISRLNPDSDYQFVVHMGTTGIHAGAREVMFELMKVVADLERQDVIVRQSGAAGDYGQEPIVDVIKKDGSSSRFSKVNLEMIPQLIDSIK